MRRFSLSNTLAALVVAATAGLGAQGAAAQADFSADYTPASVPLGGTSRLELAIDNSAGANSLFSLNVTSTLPAGLMIADPANLVNDCPVTVTAVAGTGTIQTQPGGFIPLGAAASCTVGVDIIGAARGSFNTEAKVTYNETSVGAVEKTAAASLTVTGSGALQMIKAFTDDPVAPGGTAALEFTLSNSSRGGSATNVGFTDDLAAMLAGATLDAVGSNSCGASVTGTGTGTISVSGGTIASGASCKIGVSVRVPPGGGSSGTHVNTVSDLAGTIAGATVTGAPASASLTVFGLLPPVLTKSFDKSRANPGDPLAMTFTLTNPNAGTALSGISFTDDVGAFVSGATIAALPAGSVCGGGVGRTGAEQFGLFNGTLAGGDYCAFTVDVQLPSVVPPADYTNTTSPVTFDDGAATVVGRAASATMTVGGAANISFFKEFSDPTALAGETVQLTFDIRNSRESSDATALEFTDNLGDAVTAGLPPVFLAGTTIQSIDSNTCGTASGAGTGVFRLTGGTLAPGVDCAIVLTLQLPSGAAPGAYANTTSRLGFTAGTATSVAPASATLRIQEFRDLVLSKAFIGGPALPGGTATMRFTIENPTPQTANAIGFSDNLSAFIPGATLTGPIPSEPCGTGSAFGGSTFVTLTGGNIAGGGSCSFDVAVSIPGTAAPGEYTNSTTALTYTLAAAARSAAAATADLQVLGRALTLFKTYIDNPASPGGTATIEYRIENLVSGTLTNIGFTDDLGASLFGLAATGLPQTDVCGTGSTLSGTGTLTLSGGILGAASACRFTVTVAIPPETPAGSYPGATGQPSATLGGNPVQGDPASDTLNVRDAAAPSLSKSFANGGLAAAGGTTRLDFTLTNNSPTAGVTGLRFTDDLDAMLAGATMSGVVSNDCDATVTGASTVAVTGARLDPGASCTIGVSVMVPAGAAPGSYVNRTSNLQVDAIFAAPPATASLEVQPAPAFSKAFAPAAALPEIGAPTRLTFTIDNGASALDAANLSLVDNLPAGMVVADPANTGQGGNCAGGSISAAPGAGTISYAGGTVTAGAVCEIWVDVTTTAAGRFDNTTADLTSTLGNSGAASASLDVAPAAAPTIAKTFSAAAAVQGETLDMTITLVNPNGFIPIRQIDLVDVFKPGLEIVTPAQLGAGCSGGSVSGAAGDSALGYANGTIPAGGTCTVTAGVRITGSAMVENTASVTSEFNAAPLSSTAFVSVSPAGAPLLSKSFSATAAQQGETVRLDIAVTNPNAFQAAGNVAVTDAFPAGLVLATAPMADAGCGGGTLTGAAGDAALGYAGGSVAPGATCTISADVTVTGTADIANVAQMTSDLNAVPIDARADLAVTAATAPTLAKRFAAATAVQGETLGMTLAVTNPNGFLAAGNVAVTDAFPPGLMLAGTPTADAGCSGGTLTGAAGDATLGYGGGSIAPGATCTISADVTVTGTADIANVAQMTSDLNPGPVDARASLAVTPAPPPGFAKAYAPATILAAGTTRATFSIDNAGALAAARNLAFTDRLDPSITVANTPNITTTCTGATVVAAPGGSDVSLSGGTVAAGTACSIGVDLVAAQPGTFAGRTGPLTSSLGSSGTASATLTVLDNPTGEITIVQRADPDGSFGFSSDTAALNFTIATSGGEGTFGPVTLPAGSYDISQSLPEGFGNVAMRCSDGDSRTDARARTLRIALARDESVTCTIASIRTDEKTVETINKFLFRRADLVLSSEPSLGRRIDRLLRGFGNASALRFSTGDLMAFSPLRFDPMAVSSRNVAVGGSLLSMRQAAASLKLAHGATSDTAYVANYRWDAWFEAQYKKFDDSQGTGDFGILHFGADYLVNENLLIGIMGQVDRLQEESATAGTTASGTGWMAGPYMTARLAPNLFFDARVAAGTSVNDISPFNTYTDSFDTTRWMATMNLSGDFQRGAWTIRPNASLAYYEEKQESYVDSLGVTIASQTIGLTQFKLGPTFLGRFEDANGTLYQPSFSLEAIYNAGTTMGVTLDDPEPHSEGWRGRAQAGIRMTAPGGASFGFGASLDGLFRDDFETFGLSLDVSIPLSKPVAR